MAIFRGCGVAIATPFKNDGSVDFYSFKNLINWQIEEGIDAIVVCGTTGEASTLTDKEHVEVVDFCVKTVNNRVPVIAGSGSNNTQHAVEMSQALEAVGVDGLLLVTPYYNKCSQKGLIEHYIKIADSVNIPSILYSVPGRTGVNILPQTVLELSKHKNIVGIKEASGNISQVMEISRIVPSDFSVYSGNDDMVVPVLSLGGMGYISVVANIAPKKSAEIVSRWFKGDIEGSRNIQFQMKPLIDAMFCEVNPIPVKAALNLMGKIDLSYRLPLCAPDDSAMERIKREMVAFGLI